MDNTNPYIAMRQCMQVLTKYLLDTTRTLWYYNVSTILYGLALVCLATAGVLTAYAMAMFLVMVYGPTMQHVLLILH